MSTSPNIQKQPKDNYNTKLHIKSGILFFVCVLLTIICILPIYLLIVNSTKDTTAIRGSFSLIPGKEFIENFNTISSGEKFPNFNALRGFRNSAIITVSATFLSVFFSALTAYGLYVYDFKLRGPAYTFILGVMMVPMQVSSIGFLKFVINLGWYGSFLPLILPTIAAPAIVFFMRQYLQSSFPLDIVEAARIDGCGEFRTFLTIAIPMMKPAIAVQAIFAFIANWNNLYMPNMLLGSSDTHKTLPMMINGLISDDKNSDYGAFYCAIAISILPLIIAYLIFSKFIVEGVALGGVKE